MAIYGPSELFETAWLTEPYSSKSPFCTATYSVGVSAVVFLAATFLPPDFSLVVLFAEYGYDFPFAALTAARRFLDASAIAFLPSALIFRFGLADAMAGFDGSDLPRIFAQRSCWASFILRRVSAESFQRFGVVPAAVAAVFAGPSLKGEKSLAWSRTI